MIYLTGDIHRTQDIQKILPSEFDYTKVSKDDLLLIAGDFGCVWTGDERDAKLLDWFASLPLTVLFIDGNHENFDLLYQYPEELWNGGRVHRIRDNLLHLMRGQVFTIEGRKWFTFGGGSSRDKSARTPGVSWWPQELPSKKEFAEGIRNLELNGWETDIVLTHCAPQFLLKAMVPAARGDILNTWLDGVAKKLTFTHWYLGHYHIDTDVQKYSILFRRIIRIPPAQ